MAEALERQQETPNVPERQESRENLEEELQDSSEVFDEAELQAFQGFIEQARNEQARDEDPVLEVREPKSTSPEYDAQKGELMKAAEEQKKDALFQGAQERQSYLSSLLERGTSVLQKFDLDTKEKVAANLLTVAWGSGIICGVVGLRPDELSRSGVTFKSMDYTERVAYVAGDIVNLPLATSAIDFGLRKVGADAYIEKIGASVRDAVKKKFLAPAMSFVGAS